VTNTGKPYEALTERVFQRLLAQEKPCVNVRRDTTIQGKSTTHQIDVSFDFVMGPLKFQTLIECKDRTSAIKQEQVLAFNSVLDDVQGRPRGIMVSCSGFQEGARNYARDHSIELYELRAPKDEDWAGLFRSAEIDLMIQNPEYRNVTPCLDEPWMRNECDRLGVTSPSIAFTLFPDLRTTAFESDGYCDLRGPLGEHMASFTEEWTPIRHEFPEGLMFQVAEGPLPVVRAIAVTAEARVTLTRTRISVSLDHIVAYCFRDVLIGTFRFLDKDGNNLNDVDSRQAKQ
jgi:hypothetical protein